jgi:hypothetical protein
VKQQGSELVRFGVNLGLAVLSRCAAMLKIAPKLLLLAIALRVPLRVVAGCMIAGRDAAGLAGAAFACVCRAKQGCILRPNAL